MEVKINNNGEMLDATIEVVDGVMVVSPKVKYVPKDGDVVFQKGAFEWIFIYKDCCTVEACEYVSLKLSENKLYFPDGGHIGYISTLRLATEEEKKKLFDRLAEEGYEFDFEKKELVKLKWKPKVGEIFYTIAGNTCSNNIFFVESYKWVDDSRDNKLYYRRIVFKTKEECQEFCNRLNDAINSVKL